MMMIMTLLLEVLWSGIGSIRVIWFSKERQAGRIKCVGLLHWPEAPQELLPLLDLFSRSCGRAEDGLHSSNQVGNALFIISYILAKVDTHDGVLLAKKLYPPLGLPLNVLAQVQDLHAVEADVCEVQVVQGSILHDDLTEVLERLH